MSRKSTARAEASQAGGAAGWRVVTLELAACHPEQLRVWGMESLVYLWKR